MTNPDTRQDSPAIKEGSWRLGPTEHYALGHTRSIERINDGVWDEVAEVWCEEGDESLAHLFLAAPEMYDLLSTIENDDKQVPKWLWDRIQDVLEKVRGGV